MGGDGTGGSHVPNQLSDPDSVPWSSLQHAYGAADDVPGLLRAAAGPVAGAVAVDELSVRIFHQGGAVCSAASAAAPFLVTPAADPDVVARVDLLDLLGDLALAGRTARTSYVNSAWRNAWAQALPRLLALLDDRDPAVRRRVAYPLAQAVDVADMVSGALRRRWSVEPDHAARLGYLLAVGQLLRNARKQGSLEAREWLTGLSAGSDGPQRLAVILALRRADPQRIDAHDVETILMALRETDLTPWGQAWCGSDQPPAMITWVDSLLREDRDGRTRLAAGLIDHRDAAHRSGALCAAAEVTSRWRSPTAQLLPLVAERLLDPDGDNRSLAAYLLAACGQQAAAWADVLADACADPEPSVADLAVLALTRLGDRRCIEPLLNRLSGPRLGFPLNSHHGGGWWIRPPGILDVLSAVPQFAPLLLAAVCARLRAADTLDERRTFARVVAAWGAAVGPAAARAVSPARTRALLTDAQHHASERELAVKAYWGLTGDPQPALDLLLPKLDDPYRASTALDFLAELGHPGYRHVDRVRALLHRGDEPWLTAAAAAALWRMTGDPTEVVPALIIVVRPLTANGRVWPPTMRAIAVLGEIGPPAVDAAPVLELVLARDRRPVEPGQWDSIPCDDKLQQAATAALQRITRG